MTLSQITPTPRWRLALGSIALLVVGIAGGWYLSAGGANNGAASNLSSQDRLAMEQVVHDYLLSHPEILPQAIDKLRAKEGARLLSGIADKITAPFPGAILGNPAGKVVLVEFSDFACGFCRRSVAEVEALIAENPDLKVVIRELPIIAPTSPAAARMGLAAAGQGKYAAFHTALYAAGRTDQATIDAVAQSVGLDLAAARQAMTDPRFNAELEANLAFARQLGLTGTPSWVVGNQVLQGAVGKDTLAKAIAAARKS